MVAAAQGRRAFDPQRSWLLGEAGGTARTLTIAATVLFVFSGVLVIAGAHTGATLAVIGAGVSLILVALTFNRWLVGAVAIDVAIAIVAL